MTLWTMDGGWAVLEMSSGLELHLYYGDDLLRCVWLHSQTGKIVAWPVTGVA